jgi:hypothetical protein
LTAKIRARSRARQIIRRPRLLLLLAVCGAMLVVAMTAVGASAAYYTASSDDGGSVVAAGGVKLALVPASEIVDLRNLKPGDSRSGSIQVRNTLNEATVTLGIADLQQTPTTAGLDQLLDVVVQETAPGQVVRFSGKLGALHGVPIGTMGAGATATFTITVSWPGWEDDPSRQGATASFVFEWAAVST